MTSLEQCKCQSVTSDSLRPHGLQPTRLLCPRNSPRKNTGVGSHSFLQGIFLTERSNPGLLHCRQILYYLSHQDPSSQYMLHIFSISNTQKERIINYVLLTITENFQVNVSSIGPKINLVMGPKLMYCDFFFAEILNGICRYNSRGVEKQC